MSQLQLINQFLKDNSHLHLLSSISSSSNAASSMLSHALLSYAHNVMFMKHLDNASCHLVVSEFVPANKYTISSFAEFKMDAFLAMYWKVYPNVFEQNPSTYLSH